MDSIDVVSIINEIVNSNLSDSEKIDNIKETLNEYFEECIDDYDLEEE